MLRPFAALLILALGLLGVTHAQPLKGPGDVLGADGFPLDWQASDLETPPVVVTPTLPVQGPRAVTPIQVVVPFAVSPVIRVSATAKQPVSWRVDQMRSVAITPSGTTPIALPAEKEPVRVDVSRTGYIPLAAAFANGTPAVMETTGARVGTEGLQNDSLESLAAYGPLNAAAGGLGSQVWKGGSSTAVLPKQVAGAASPAVREAWRRLLLSQAVPPLELTSATVAGPQNWLVVRARLLESLNYYEAAWSLWREAGPEARRLNPALAQGWVQAGILAGQTREACALAREKAPGSPDMFWPAAVAACAAADSQTSGEAGSAASSAALGLSLQLLPAAVSRTNPALVAALTAVRDGKPLLLGTMPVDGLAASVVASYPVLLSPSALPLLPDVALRRLRQTPGLPADLRAEVANQLATQTGWVRDGAAFLDLISATQFVGNPASWPDAALVAWAKDASTTRSVSASSLVVPAALRMGEISTAQVWWAVYLRKAAASEGDDSIQLKTQLALQAVVDGKVDEPLLLRWLGAEVLVTPDDSENVQRSLLALEGLGVAISPPVWEAYRARAVDISDGVDASWRRLLEAAVVARNVPAVLGLVSEGLAGRRAVDVQPGIVGASVQALYKVGMVDIAKRLMVEAMTMKRSAGLDLSAYKARPMPEVVSPVAVVSSTSRGQAKPAAQAVEMLPPPRVKAPARPSSPTIKKPVL